MPGQCCSIRSKKNPEQRCPNSAKPDLDFCGFHVKTAIRWSLGAEASPETPSYDSNISQIQKIQGWYRHKKWYRNIHLHGIAYYDRSLCVNSEDFFSTDSMKDISNNYFFSYRDLSENQIYGFDIRSFNMLLQSAGDEPPKNPYSRSTIYDSTLIRAKRIVNWLILRQKPTIWTPTQPITAEQTWRMKVVEIFVIMEQLQYGADPEWFISLSLSQQKLFYLHLLDIWTHRAGLSQADKERIVPSTPNLFHWGITRITAIQQISTIRTSNCHIMKRLVSSAIQQSDRILGAMYILTALTQVSSHAAEAFPWLFESASEAHIVHSWINSILNPA
jgi:hypothetical protein